MKCSRCGKDVKGDSNFCANCGNPVGEGSAAGGSGNINASGSAASPPLPAGQAASPPPEGTKKRGGLIALLVVASVLIAGGAAGVLIWRLTARGGLRAEIAQVELSRKGGGPVNLEDVPLGEDLVITVKVRAQYGEGGEAELVIKLFDSAGEEQRKSRFRVRSGRDPQEFKDEFLFLWSEGEYFTAKVELKASEGDREKSDHYELEFYVAEGTVADEDFEEALERTKDKLNKAEDAVIDLGSGTDVDVDDLLQRLIDAIAAMKEADTLEELDSLYREAERIIADCADRKAAWEAEQARREEEQKKQADGGGQQPNRGAEVEACRKDMFDYAWRQMVTTPFYAEPVRIDGFWMNDQCTQAGGTMVGMKTAHTDPENAGNLVTVPISARKEGGRWLAQFDYF